MPHGSNKIYTDSFPNATHCGEDRFIGEIQDGTMLGYKYFAFSGAKEIGVQYRGSCNGKFVVSDNMDGKNIVAEIPVAPADAWTESRAPLHISDGTHRCICSTAATVKQRSRNCTWHNRRECHMIEQSIQELIQYGIEKELITSEDEIFLRNQLMDLLQLSAWETPALPEVLPTIDEILDKLVSYAAEKDIITDSNAARDLFDTRIMGLLTERPHTVNRSFFAAYHRSPEEATDWYYQYSKDTNYVRAGRIAKDLRWTYDCEYGTLDVTINRSKPEKDPRDIAAAKNQPQTKYPACQLCIENTGFAGTLTHPARQNLRPIPISIHGGNWAFQYSPYGYYNEHCIVFNQKHVPMVINAAVFEKLFDVLDMLPTISSAPTPICRLWAVLS